MIAWYGRFSFGMLQEKMWWVRAVPLLVNMAGCSGKFYEVRPLSLLLMEVSLGKASTQASLISWKGKKHEKTLPWTPGVSLFPLLARCISVYLFFNTLNLSASSCSCCVHLLVGLLATCFGPWFSTSPWWSSSWSACHTSCSLHHPLCCA